MRKLLVLLIFLLGIGSGVAWLADHPGSVIINWENWQLETSFAVLAMGGALFLFLAMLIEAGFIWAKRELPFVGANRHLKQQQKGIEALNQAVLSLAIGEGQAAKKLVDKASRLLPPQPMTHVIAAQAAELIGDKEGARREFEALSQSGEGSFLGVRGLLMSAMSEGRTREAIRLSEEALKLKPKSKWAIKTHFRLLIKEANWIGALTIFRAGLKEKCFEKEEALRVERALLFCKAREADLSGNVIAALSFARSSHSFDKGFIPAAILLSRLEKTGGNALKASKVIEATWNIKPDRRLAEVFNDLEVGERATERLRRVKKLTSKTLNHIETRIYLADQNIKAEHFEDAEGLIETLLEDVTLKSVYELKAELIRAKGESGAFEWDTKAETGEVNNIYRCSSCGTSQKVWNAICPTCDEFGSFEYKSSKEVVESIPQKSSETPIIAMLPLDK